MRRRDFIAGALALLLSVAGLLLAVPATATEVNYDPGDRLYFTYCYAHPPAIRIKPGDSAITSTRDASNDVFSPSDKTVTEKIDLTRPILRGGSGTRRHAGGPYR